MSPENGSRGEVVESQILNEVDRQYNNLSIYIRDEGVDKKDRTGVGTKSIFGYQMRFDLQAGFPMLTTKSLHFKSIGHELVWMLKGNTNISYLKEKGVRIWNEWADENDELGPVYGEQWRSWTVEKGKTVDQIKRVENKIRTDPDSRRLIVSAWNVPYIDKMALPPCHVLFQFYVADEKLSCQLYQRSADVFLGLPFNIASYALLTQMMAHTTGYEPGEFIHTLGDAHVYTNHQEKLWGKEGQIFREPRNLPKMVFVDPPKSVLDFDFHHFNLQSYEPHPPISGKVAV